MVIKRTDRPFVDRLADMAPYIARFGHAADILVYTPEEFERLEETTLSGIQEDGVVVYARP